MQLNGKRIVLTGAASGIGRELLRQLAQYNVEIIAADRDAAQLGEAVRLPENIRASLNPFVCDVGTQAGTEELFAHALATLNGVDLFIANAGFAYYERLDTTDWAHLEAIYQVNTFSPLYSTVKMNELNPENPYMVVLTASAMAHWGLAGYALYASTKAALDRFVDAYRAELPPNGRVMVVYPIATQTDFFRRAGAPVPYPIQPVEQVAAAMIRGIERDATEVHPSWLWRASLWVNRWVPVVKPLTQRVYRRMFESWPGMQS